MSNDEIRARILRLHYDLEIRNTHARFNTDELPQLLQDVPQNLIDANLNYLREARLIDGPMVMGRTTPTDTRITARGIDVVENPQRAAQYPINIQVLQVETNYGQIAQAAQGGSISQTQTYSSFNDLRNLVKDHNELKDEERKTIEHQLAELEKHAQDGTLNKKIIDQAKSALAKYGWLIPPVLQVIAKALGVHIT